MRRLWYNGAVVSMDPGMRRYEALGAEDEKIVFLGSASDGLAQAWDETVNLEGKLVLPGFSDTHMHMLYYAMFRVNLNLFGVDSIDAIVAQGRARISEQHPDFLIGMGWNQETMREGRLLEKRDMDRISTDIPLCLLRACGHVAACNSKMLELIRGLEDVGEELLRNIDFERGILREGAMRLYMEVIPPMDRNYVRRLIAIAQADMNAAGITCVHSDDLKVLSGMDPITLVRIFRELEAEGGLTLRVYEQCLVEGEAFERLLAVRSAPEDRLSLFRTGPRKLLQDGSLGAKSAEMADGYEDDPENHGIAISSQMELSRMVRAAHDVRMNVAVHAIGDLALEQVLEAIEQALTENPWPEHRHGIVHAQITNPRLLARMKDLGVHAYIQPIFIDADMHIIHARIGARRAAESYSWKTMREIGIHTSGGSDCPVEPFDVLDNIRAAVTRRSRDGTMVYRPEEALTVEEAVRLFTSDAAYPAGDEDCRCTLELGKLADLVVLDRDIFTAAPDDITNIQVIETVLNGRTIYHREIV